MYFRHTKLAYARFTKFILSQNSSVASIQLNETSFNLFCQSPFQISVENKIRTEKGFSSLNGLYHGRLIHFVNRDPKVKRRDGNENVWKE